MYFVFSYLLSNHWYVINDILIMSIHFNVVSEIFECDLLDLSCKSLNFFLIFLYACIITMVCLFKLSTPNLKAVAIQVIIYLKLALCVLMTLIRR